MTENGLLILAPRYDEDSQLLWQAAVTEGWSVRRLDSYLVGSLDVASSHSQWKRLAIYGGHMWGHEIANQLGVQLLSPPADWLTSLDPTLLGRKVWTTRMGEVADFLKSPSTLLYPGSSHMLFVKSLSWPQEFTSRVYYSPDDLPADSVINSEASVLVSEVVIFTREYRAFILDGVISTFSPYARDGGLDRLLTVADVAEATYLQSWMGDYLELLCRDLPRSVVIDVGMTPSGPAIVEANPTWCSGMYSCDPKNVLQCVEAAIQRCRV